MKSKLHILHAALGCFDDWESIVLGVFRTLEEAEGRKHKILQAVLDYHNKISFNNEVIMRLLQEWSCKTSSAKEVGLLEREKSNVTVVFCEYCKLLDHVKCFKGSSYKNSDFSRMSFYKTANEIMAKLPNWVIVEPLPEFPPIVKWEESFPLVDSHLINITEVDCE